MPICFLPVTGKSGEAVMDYLETLVAENTEDWWRTIYK